MTFQNFRKCDEVQSMINNLTNAKQSLPKRPKTIYHTLPENKETINFVVDMKPSFEEAGTILNNGFKFFFKTSRNMGKIERNRNFKRWL